MYTLPNTIRQKIYDGGLKYYPIVTCAVSRGEYKTGLIMSETGRVVEATSRSDYSLVYYFPCKSNTSYTVDITALVSDLYHIKLMGMAVCTSTEEPAVGLKPTVLTRNVDTPVPDYRNPVVTYTTGEDAKYFWFFADTVFEPITEDTVNQINIGVNISPSNIKSLEIDDPVIDTSSDTMYIGSFISKQLKMSFRNLENIDLSEPITYKIEITENSSGNTYIVPIGVFNVETSLEDYYKTLELTALDNAVKFKPNFQPMEAVVGEGITAYNLLKALCEYYEIELDETNLPETNKDAITAYVDNTVSGKQYVSYIAEIMGCNAKITRDGKLVLVPVKNLTDIRINALQGKTFTVNEEYKITKVRFDNGLLAHTAPKTEVDGGNTLSIRQGNIFIQGDNNERETVVNNLYEAIKGLTLYGLKAENYADFTLDATDIVTYTVGETSYPTYYSANFKFNGSIMGKVDVQIPQKGVEETTNTMNGTSLEREVRSIRTTVNQMTATLTTVATQEWVDSQGYQNKKQVVDILDTEGRKLYVIQEQLGNGDVSAVNAEGFVFNRDGLSISRTDEEGNYTTDTHTLINEGGMTVYYNGSRYGASDVDFFYVRYNEEKGKAEAKVIDLDVTGTLTVGTAGVVRRYSYEDGTERKNIDNTERIGFFWDDTYGG